MSYQRPSMTKTETEAPGYKPSMSQVMDELRQMFAAHGLDTQAVRWFVSACIPPYNADYERPSVVSVAGDRNATRWLTPYRDRVVDCARTYLAMGKEDAAKLHAGVEDGVRWRGEPISQYLAIYRETMRMREIGVEAYRKQAVMLLKGALL